MSDPKQPSPPKALTPDEIRVLPETNEAKRLRSLSSSGGSVTRTSDGITITEYDPARAPTTDQLLGRKISR
jgi:hypothetical protein